jgi:uncharacterized RDD family membrane protein YckC
VPYCQHCGSPHLDDATFCPQCGSWVGSVGSLQATPVAAARYAGFWPRLGGWLIDQLIIAIPFNIVTDLLVSYNQPTVTTTTDAGNNVHIHWHGDWLTLGLLLLASSVTTWLYSSILQSSSRQATVGQGALGLVITDLDGNRISFARASGRYLATFLTSLTFGIGYLMMIWTKRKQTLQDKIAGTVVIPKRH